MIKCNILLFFLLNLFLLYATTCALYSSNEKRDPEVEICRRQCARQPQFSEEERRICKDMCDEYGKEKADRQRKDGGPSREEIERQRKDCKHQCGVARLSHAEEQLCEDRCEEQYREEIEKLDEEEGKRARDMLRKVARAVISWRAE